MSSRVCKNKKPVLKTISNSGVLSAVLLGPFEMPSCSSCKALGIDRCEVSPHESSRCSNCVRNHRSGCDVLGMSSSDLLKISSQHARREQALVQAISELSEVSARVLRLQREKEEWRVKLSRAIARGISDTEELERAEAEERAQAIAETAATNVEQAESISGVDWSLPSDFALDPGLLADLGIPGSVETPRDTQSGS